MQRAAVQAELDDLASARTPADDTFAMLACKPVNAATAIGPGAPVAFGVVVATLHGFAIDGTPLLAGIPTIPDQVLQSRSVIALSPSMAGASVVVAFDQCDVRKPIVVGLLESRCGPRNEAAVEPAAWALFSDGERMVISAQREVVLQCGEASITLTRAGKVLIKGAYILSRSSGNNKIKGATVEIN